MTSPVALVSIYYLGLRSSLPWCGSSLSGGSNGGDDTARHLCRSGTVDDVRRKAEELGLLTKEKPPL